MNFPLIAVVLIGTSCGKILFANIVNIFKSYNFFHFKNRDEEKKR